ncbi:MULTISPECIES: DedA family protein [unclassified Plantibacter]|uniref:DedA family protein n=1 Tax=unclassified Plantibacter TaxID=2624265 RepID=UPI0009E92A4B|nr:MULTISPECIES: DedA family protein [unclassified Plantibacter]
MTTSTAATISLSTASTGGDSALGGVAEWAVGLMETLGGPGAALAIALENLFPPLPSEIILPLAGFAASQGKLGLVEVLVWTTAGSVVGALALYAIGAVLGRDRMRRLVARVPLVHVEDVDRVEAWFQKHGSKAVFFGRMLPIFRSLISIPAGVERMPVLRFALLTLAGSGIWNTIFVLAGFFLGEQWHIVEEYAGILQKVVIAGVVIALGFTIWKGVKRYRRERSAATSSDD